MRKTSWFRTSAVLALSSALAIGPAAATQAYDVFLTFDSPTERTITYGESWYFSLQAADLFATTLPVPLPVSAEVTGPFNGVIDGFQMSRTSGGTASGAVYLPANQPPTPVGDYQVQAYLRVTYYDWIEYVATAATPAHLVVEPAALVIDQKIVADPNNPANAIVSASMSGPFIDNFGWTINAPEEALTTSTPRIPQGSWSISIRDGDNVLLERKITQPSGGSPDISIYWADIPSNTEFTSTITFTPEGSAAGNFDVTQATPFLFTSAFGGRPVPRASSIANAQPDAPLEDQVALPLWTVVLAVLLGLALLAAIVVLLVSESRQASTHRLAVATVDNEDHGQPTAGTMVSSTVETVDKTTGNDAGAAQ